MTLEAWVNPSTINDNWRDVVYKGDDNYYLEATSSNASRPDAGVIAGGSYGDAYGTAALADQHLDAPGRDLRRQRRSASTSTAPRSPRPPTPA